MWIDTMKALRHVDADLHSFGASLGTGMIFANGFGQQGALRLASEIARARSRRTVLGFGRGIEWIKLRGGDHCGIFQNREITDRRFERSGSNHDHLGAR
jgi:hypothetical protein